MRHLMPAVLTAIAIAIATAAHAQQFTMKISSPTNHDATTEYMRLLKASVESKSGGKIKVEGYPANQLGQLPRVVEGVSVGTIEVAISAIGFYVPLEPRFEALEVPGLFDDMRHLVRVVADPELKKRFATFGNARGIETVWTSVQSPLTAISHKAIRSLADFKGQKLRTPGPTPIHMEPLKKLGVAPIGMALGEALPAMQNRTIDGVVATVNVFNVFKYYDIAKAATTLPGSFLVFAAVANRNWMKSLGPELEAMVREELITKGDHLNATFAIPDYERAVASWEKAGGQLHTLASAEVPRYLEEVRTAVTLVLDKQPRVKEDYEAILAVARKLRQ